VRAARAAGRESSLHRGAVHVARPRSLRSQPQLVAVGAEVAIAAECLDAVAPGVDRPLEREFGLHMDVSHKSEEDDSLTEAKITDLVLDAVLEAYQAKTDAVGERVMRERE